METDDKNKNESRISNVISLGKDIISLLRDGALLVLAILLVVFPLKFNAILVGAGFKEGNVAGFKWQSSLVSSNQALEEAQAKISELQRVSNEQVKALSEAKVLLSDTALKQRITNIEKDNITQKESTGIVQSSVAHTINTNVKLVENSAPSRNKSDFLVGLQTLGLSDTERTDFNSKLQSSGYGLAGITVSYPAGARPLWFASRPTVFYYSASALPAAQELARVMKNLTNQDFAVQRGAGLGVDPSLRDVTLYVHLIRS